jgi:predicted N-acetyltransferase YhbS
MAEVTFREGGAIPYKQVADLFTALGRDAEVARLDGRLAELLHHSTFVVSAWDGAALVGAARVVSDQVAVSFVQHVGVHPAYRHRGIGGELLSRCLARFGHTTIIVLLDDPGDAGFYAHFGFQTTSQAMLRAADLGPP